MAFGTVAGMRRYVNKTFALETKLAAFTDGRVAPTVPQAPVLATWFWGLTKRLPSTEQVGDLLRDPRWRHLVGLRPQDGGSPDTAGRILDGLCAAEWHEFLLECFFVARRAGMLGDDGPYGQRCAIIDLNELFTTRSTRHCPDCQQREVTVLDAAGEKHKVTEYFHQAVALVWAGGEVAWPIGWDVLQPGEGELTAAYRLLARLLPRLRQSLDLVLGDALYCCRPFFELVCGAGLQGFAICNGHTDLDEEMDFLQRQQAPRLVCGGDVAQWELETTAWEHELKLGRPLRVLHCERRTVAKPWKHERRTLRVVTSAPLEILPAGQGWKVGRGRWKIENGAFNLLTHDYALTHNYRHSAPAILGLLVLRAVAACVTWAYRRFATARSKQAPRDFLRWYQLVLSEDWVRYLDGALTGVLTAANPRGG
jgi:hypothetical protein